MDKTPTISIIVPVYNVEKYLRQCIDSILAQTYTDFELLLIDDGSPDNSGKICDEYAQKDTRIRVFHKPNGGVSTARNMGIDNARGEYISFIDADDWVEPNYCQTIVDNIGDFDIMFFSEVWHYKDGCVSILSSGECERNGREEIEKEILHMLQNTLSHKFFGYTWDKAFRKDIIYKHKLRFVEGLYIREDEIFTLNYCHKINSLKTIYAPIYNYRCMSNGLTSTHRPYSVWELYIKNMVYLTNQLKNEELITHIRTRLKEDIVNIISSQEKLAQRIKLIKAFRRLCRLTSLDFPAQTVYKKVAKDAIKSIYK